MYEFILNRLTSVKVDHVRMEVCVLLWKLVIHVCVLKGFLGKTVNFLDLTVILTPVKMEAPVNHWMEVAMYVSCLLYTSRCV